MSVIINISRNANEKRCFYLRDFQFSFGFDEMGVLTWENVHRAIFTMSAREEGYRFKCEAGSLKFNGEEIAKGTEKSVTEQAFIEFEDSAISLWITSGESEVLARVTDVPLESLVKEFSNVPVLKVKLGNAVRAYPLLPHLPVSVGTDATNMVQLNLPGMKPFHCSLEYSHPTVKLEEIQGKVCIGEEPITGVELIRQNRTITLQPLGITAEIHFPLSAG